MRELTIKTFILDYLEPVNGGIPILIGISLDSFTFQAVYWIHSELENILKCESDFLKLFGVSKTEDLTFYNELLNDIDNIVKTDSIRNLTP